APATIEASIRSRTVSPQGPTVLFLCAKAALAGARHHRRLSAEDDF
ncbi:hypothetical protein HMPREF0185_00557, partial [Brevundimonas diminuta 470-4]